RHQRPTRDRLQGDAPDQHASEHVGPARSARHRLVPRVFHERAVAGSLVEPVAYFFEGHPTSSRSGTPFRNFLNFTSTTRSAPSPMTRTSTGSMSRGDGPDLRLPAGSKLDVWHGQPNPPPFHSMPHPR